MKGPRPDHIRDPKYDPKVIDTPGLELLGKRQEKFLPVRARDKKGPVKAGPKEGWADGWGLIRFQKPTNQVTFECWPRFEDVTKPNPRQFPGWPKTISL